MVGRLHAGEADPERLGLLMAGLGEAGGVTRSGWSRGGRRRVVRPDSLVPAAVAITSFVTVGFRLAAGANPLDAYDPFIVEPLTSRFTGWRC